MNAILDSMPRKSKKPTDPKPVAKDAASKPFMFRMHPAIRSGLEKAVEMNASDLSTEVHIAIREYLKSLGIWPPRD